MGPWTIYIVEIEWQQKTYKTFKGWVPFYYFKGGDMGHLSPPFPLSMGLNSKCVNWSNLHSLERAERMMVRWMCGVLLKEGQKAQCGCVVFYVFEVWQMCWLLRHGRLRWFGHLKRKGVDDWMSVCRNVMVAGVRCVGRGRKTWGECVKDDMRLLGLQPELAA